MTHCKKLRWEALSWRSAPSWIRPPLPARERQHRPIAPRCGHSSCAGRYTSTVWRARCEQIFGEYTALRGHVPGNRGTKRRGAEGGSLPMPRLDYASSGTPGLRQDSMITVSWLARRADHEARCYWVGERLAACRFTDSAEWLRTLSLCLMTWRSTLSARRSIAA